MMAEAVLEKSDTIVTPEAMTARVLSDARRAFGDRADEHVLEHYTSQAIAGLWRDSIKVTTFVPVLALRQVRDMLEGDSGAS
jgi:hypothetical protein